MQINRPLQEAILRHLTECFPFPPEDSFYNGLITAHGQKEVLGTILYLHMHKLIECEPSSSLGCTMPQICWALTKPTEKAFDFLADDGGLSAILGVVTVKLHNDTIQALLAAKIDQADISSAEKIRLKDTLSKMGDAALAKFTEKAIDAVTSPQIINLLQTLYS